MTGLKHLVSKAIENHIEKKAAKDGSATAIIPGSPIIEFAASEQGKKWTQITDVLEKDGLSKSFSGIIVNGRVSIRRCNLIKTPATLNHFSIGRRSFTH